MRLLSLLFLAPALMSAERINHAGRILGPVLTVTAPVQFNTPQADAIVASMQIMPTDSAWYEDISGYSLLGNSGAMITKITNDLSASNRHLVVFEEMNYVLVPDSQPLVGIRFVTYPSDSDFNGGTSPIATWPVPSIMPIETWPSGTGAQTLEQWQRATGGDRHSIIVQPGAQRLYETWRAQLTNNTPVWQASNGAIFPLDSNAPRPPGWTSGDAAGLPMFPALVRYDECQRGVIEHALRIVVKTTREDYIYPASHEAGDGNDANTPAMGQRLRLRENFDLDAISWSAQERAVLVALKKYGALVADNGNFFSVSICPDDRWPADCWSHLAPTPAGGGLSISDFEVVQTTGATTGPRAGGKPGAVAGDDQTVVLADGADLNGTLSGGGAAQWSVYPADGPQAALVHFDDVTSADPSVTFDAAGSYTLLLKSSKAGFTPAYDAVVITVLVSISDNPTPTLSELSPSTRIEDSGAFTMTLTGANFRSSSMVTWSGQATLTPLTTSATELTVAVPASYLNSSGTSQVRVVNPSPGGGTSTPLTAVIFAAPAGSGGSSGGGGSGGGGGCGLGGGAAALIALLMLVWRRW